MTKLRNYKIVSVLAVSALVAAVQPGYAGTIVYDNFQAPGGYTLADYYAKWSTPYGLGEMAVNDTRNFVGGKFNISAAPFKTSYDYSVYDHLKYISASNSSFAVPQKGSLTFSTTIQAQTPGVQDGRIINGTYIQSGAPYSAPTFASQQAAAVMNMIDFSTGQLFDIFISGNQAMTLYERLPSAVVNPSLNPGDPGYVGIGDIYTQIAKVANGIGGGPHQVSIRYSHDGALSGVDYYLDGSLLTHIGNIGIPLDAQGVPFTGTYPSYGPGEPLATDIQNFAIGFGLFSVVDSFPFQLSERPDLAVSVPIANRIFGQGAIASFGSFEVTTTSVPEPGTWSMMLAGFGALGWIERRRRAGLQSGRA